MKEYQPLYLWEATRAVVTIAAWWLLFCGQRMPEQRWRRIALIAAMPSAYLWWILMPMSEVVNAIAWTGIIILFAFLRGDLRRTLFAAFFYIGLEMSVDLTRSACIAVLFGGWFLPYSPGYYLQYNLQYLVLLGAVWYFVMVMKRYVGTPTLSGWLLCIIPPFGLWALLLYVGAVADPLLDKQGINIYGPGACFGLFSIMCNLAVLYVYTHLLGATRVQALAIELSDAEPLWTEKGGVSAAFSEKYALTDRERDVVNALMEGLNNPGIAEKLFVSRKTVEAYLTEIYRKTGVTNRFALYTLIKGQ